MEKVKGRGREIRQTERQDLERQRGRQPSRDREMETDNKRGRPNKRDGDEDSRQRTREAEKARGSEMQRPWLWETGQKPADRVQGYGEGPTRMLWARTVKEKDDTC